MCKPWRPRIQPCVLPLPPSPPPSPALQSARDKASKEFRTATSAILFSSDVSARGVDYPDVTMVLQVRRWWRRRWWWCVVGWWWWCLCWRGGGMKCLGSATIGAVR